MVSEEGRPDFSTAATSSLAVSLFRSADVYYQCNAFVDDYSYCTITSDTKQPRRIDKNCLQQCNPYSNHFMHVSGETRDSVGEEQYNCPTVQILRITMRHNNNNETTYSTVRTTSSHELLLPAKASLANVRYSEYSKYIRYYSTSSLFTVRTVAEVVNKTNFSTAERLCGHNKKRRKRLENPGDTPRLHTISSVAVHLLLHLG